MESLQDSYFDEKKVTALSIELFKKMDIDRMPYLKLMKLLYLCDRQMLENYGQLITNDVYVSMKYGPVLSNTLNLIRNGEADIADAEETQEKSFWDKYFLHPKGSFELECLSKEYPSNILNVYEKRIAQNFAEVFKETSTWNVVHYTHALCPEWQNPEEQGLKMLPIHINDIKKHLRSVNHSA